MIGAPLLSPPPSHSLWKVRGRNERQPKFTGTMDHILRPANSRWIIRPALSFAANCRAAHSCYAEHVTPKFDGDRNFPIEPEGVADKVGS